MPYPLSLKDKVALMVGGAEGIGAKKARRFSACGTKIAITIVSVSSIADITGPTRRSIMRNSSRGPARPSRSTAAGRFKRQ
jgi:NAD(P)-dependent dehydrogenase (short-subunit alcohol dehydrogenase family)